VKGKNGAKIDFRPGFSFACHRVPHNFNLYFKAYTKKVGLSSSFFNIFNMFVKQGGESINPTLAKKE